MKTWTRRNQSLTVGYELIYALTSKWFTNLALSIIFMAVNMWIGSVLTIKVSQIFQSQTHRMIGNGRDLWRSPSLAPRQAGSPTAHCTEGHPGRPWVSPEKETPQTPQPLWATCHPHSKEYFPQSIKYFNFYTSKDNLCYLLCSLKLHTNNEMLLKSVLFIVLVFSH